MVYTYKSHSHQALIVMVLIHEPVPPMGVNSDATGGERLLWLGALEPRKFGDWTRPLHPPPPQSSLRSSPCAHWGPNSAWSSRRSSWNSLGRAPSLKRRSQCGERESLLSGEGRGSTDEEAEDSKPGAGASPGTHAAALRRAESLGHRGTLDVRPLPPDTLLPPKLHDCNGQVLSLPSEFFLRIDSHKEDPAEFDDDMEDVSEQRGPCLRPLLCWFPEGSLSIILGEEGAGQAEQDLT